MKILLLSGNQSRHFVLAGMLESAGFEVFTFAEEKQFAIGSLSESLINENGLDSAFLRHESSLRQAFIETFPQPSGSLNIERVPRGAFAKIDFLDQLIKLSPDLVLTFGCGIIGGEILSAFTGRIIGSHQGLPQYYRGSGSNFFAVLEGSPSFVGASIHFLDNGIDTGPVIVQCAPAPQSGATYYSHSANLVRWTLESYVQICKDWFRHDFRKLSQDLPFRGLVKTRKDASSGAVSRFLSLLDSTDFVSWFAEDRQRKGAPRLLGSYEPALSH